MIKYNILNYAISWEIQNGNLRLSLRTILFIINTKTWRRKRFLSIVNSASCFVMERNFLLTIHDAFICAISSRTDGNLNTCNMMITRDKWNRDDKQYRLQSNRYQMVRINGNCPKIYEALYAIIIFFINEYRCIVSYIFLN